MSRLSRCVPFCAQVRYGSRQEELCLRQTALSIAPSIAPRFLQTVFDRVDKDNKGCLTLDELKEVRKDLKSLFESQGARTDAEFQSRLRVMDIDEEQNA